MLFGCVMYRSFASLRMTTRRIRVILSKAKDLYTTFTNSAEQKYSYRILDIPQVSVKNLFFFSERKVYRFRRPFFSLSRSPYLLNRKLWNSTPAAPSALP